MSKNELPQSLFGSSGIRGLVNEFITGPLAIRIGLATAHFLRTHHTSPQVMVGYDHRPTGPMLASALLAGLLQGGVSAVNAGIAPTPSIAYAAGKQGMKASLIVTASHNPPEYNGFKFHNPDGAGFAEDQQREIERLLTEAEPAPWQEFAKTIDADPIPTHLSAIVDASEVTKPHRIVLDGALGVGGLITPNALRQLGAEVKTLNVPPDGQHYAQNCGPSKVQSAAAAEWQHFVCLDDLSAIVQSTKAEVGIAHDGDADRVLAVDDKGRVLAGDILLALIADYYLATRGGKVIATTVSSSSAVDHVAKKHGVRVERCRVGDVFVSNLVKTEKAVLGAEPSGPFIFPEVHYCPDGPLAACKVLELLDWAKQPLSALVDALPETFLLRASVKCPNDQKSRTMKAVTIILEGWAEVESVNKLDGVRISFQDASWVLIRPSGTEPVIRVTVEALKGKRAKTLLKQAQTALAGIIK
ncbi:MAG: phosphoglucosamine mutase [Candidatus Hermodarchaeota archaeon]|nr:phosphoglucosamine mutase [Candidatus Hermodarchaeota archaeon]